MKFLNLFIGYLMGFILAFSITLPLMNERDLKIKKLTHERDMYNKLYRTANTNLMHFQDSINKHCICH